MGARRRELPSPKKRDERSHRRGFCRFSAVLRQATAISSTGNEGVQFGPQERAERRERPREGVTCRMRRRVIRRDERPPGNNKAAGGARTASAGGVARLCRSIKPPASGVNK